MTAAGTGGPVPVPAGWRLRPDPSLRARAGGLVIAGGSPFRVLRLSPAGAALVSAWLAGAPVGATDGERDLARRLLDAGLAHPDPDVAPDLAQLTVVVPVHDRPDELRRCLASVPPACPVVVVDDGSADGGPAAAVAAERGAQLVRLPVSRGPAAARNAGLAAVSTPFVAFVDSDCVLADGFPGRLLGHLADPAVAVAAPRIVALCAGPHGLLEAYEAAHSALDMGPREALVRPGTVVPYVPSAAFVARVAALGGGFDERLRFGEDVDLLWRLHAAGWQSRYDPAVTVGHDHRVRWRPWFTRRVAYNKATAPLLQRHPGSVPALVLPKAGLVFWAAALAGAPRAAVGATVVEAIRLRGRLAPALPGAGPTAARLVLQSRAHEGRQFARALAGPWLPALVLATVRGPQLRRRLWAVVAAGLLADWAQTRSEPTPLHFAPPRLADDGARGIGVWLGCLRHRTLRPLGVRVR